MEHDSEITAEYVLRNRRTPLIQRSGASSSPDAAQMLHTFREQYKRRCDAGIWNRLSILLLEPRNPFDVRAPRPLRQEAVVIGALLLFALALMIVFNINAVVG